jgi:kelch-like protein 11
MEGGDVLSVAVDSTGHHATVSQAALLEQIQQQQQQQQQQLVLATPADPSGNGTGIQVQEPQRGIEMIEFFRKQREREKFCDVILHVQGKQFFAHRMVLAAGSAYFDSIFKSKKTMRENLAISCQDPEIFQNFLNYFYTGSITLKKNNVGELIRLSHHFLVGKLKAYCAEFLERYMDVSNCLHVRQIAEKFQLPSLIKAAIEFVQNNLGELINHEIMMDLPPKQIEYFVTEKVC